MTLPANIQELTARLESTRDFAASAAEGDTYLKMNKGGRWTIGTDEDEIYDGTRFAVNPASFATGYSAFDNNNNRVGEAMARLDESPIVQADLPNVNAPWGKQIGFEVACVACEDEPEDVGRVGLIYQRSRGGLKAGLALLEAMLEKMNAGDTKCVPIVELRSDSYKHNKYGTIYTAEFVIVGWASQDAADAGQIEDTPEPEKKPRGRKKAAEKPKQIEQAEEPQETTATEEPQEEAPAPTRRARRRA